MAVYFIRPVGMAGPIKIGLSISPDKRRETLETWSPFPLEVAAELSGGLHLEQRFHAMFREQHQSREWFAWSPELQQVIDEVAAGTFDISRLPDPRMLTRKPKDRSYDTPAWRYQRSVFSRINSLYARGLSFREVDELKLNRISEEVEEVGTEAVRAKVEPIIAAWQQRYPSKTAMRRRPAQFRHLAQAAA